MDESEIRNIHSGVKRELRDRSRWDNDAAKNSIRWIILKKLRYIMTDNHYDMRNKAEA